MKTNKSFIAGVLLSISGLMASCSHTAENKVTDTDLLKQTYTGHAHEVIDISKREGAEEVAPKTLSIAEAMVKETDTFIEANPTQMDEIKARSQSSRNAAEHALIITRKANELKVANSEDVALSMEAEQARVRMLEKERMIASATVAEPVMETSEAFSIDRVYLHAINLFSAGEATVKKEDDETLLIRLTGLKFKSNSSELGSKEHRILSKVQRVIQEFGRSAVFVEGHTDSIGSAKLNEKISLARAEAVKDFLFSNTDADFEITAVGYGSEKPIATNMTAEGRAQNRRVDVRIEAMTREPRISAVIKVAE